MELRNVIGRRRRSVVGPTSSVPVELVTDPAVVLEEAERLIARGRPVAAVDLLAEANRRRPDRDIELRLRDLRHEAVPALVDEPVPEAWPPRYTDPFPELSGDVPTIHAGDLTTEVLGGAVQHHGAMRVRGLLDLGRAAELVDAIVTTQEHRDLHAEGGGDDVWFRPFPADGGVMTAALRRMVAEQGGTWLADSPRCTAKVLDTLATTGVTDVIARHFGERPVFSLQKSTLRRSAPVYNLTAWHQDGSFLDEGVRTMNVWLSLSSCGGDRPCPALEVVPKRIPEVLPVDGDLTPHAVDFDLVDEVAADAPVIRPEFEPGDALLFDEKFLHRTYLSQEMTYDRFAVECWFFASSHATSSYVPFVA